MCIRMKNKTFNFIDDKLQGGIKMEFLKMIMRRITGIETRELETQITELDSEIVEYQLLLKRIIEVASQNNYSIPAYKLNKIKELVEDKVQSTNSELNLD